MENNFISIVCRLYNNEAAIEPFLEKICEFLESHFKQYEIICVDDSSSDGTCEKVGEFARKTNVKALTLVRLSYKQGTEHALHAGTDLAIGDFVFEFESLLMDYSDALLFEAYQTAIGGNDVVGAGPSISGSPASRIFYYLFNRISNIPNVICTERFRIISRRGINRMNSMYGVFPYRKVIFANIGLRSTFISYPVSSRRREKHSFRELRDRCSLAANSFIFFTNIAYTFSIVIAVFLMLACATTGAYSMLVRFSGHPVASGWTSMMCYMSGIGAMLSFLFVMTLKYLSILTLIAIRKNNYTVYSIDKL